jgi:hypothetical protein
MRQDFARIRVGVSSVPDPLQDLGAIDKLVKRMRLTMDRFIEQEYLTITQPSFVDAVKRYPLWVIKKAADNIMGGRSQAHSNSSYPANPAELAKECETVLMPFRANYKRLERILDADRDEEVTTPEQREKNLAMLETLKAELAASVDPFDPRAKRALNVKQASPEERLAQIASDPSYRSFTIGTELRRKLGVDNIDKHCQPSHPEPEEP